MYLILIYSCISKGKTERRIKELLQVKETGGGKIWIIYRFKNLPNQKHIQP